VSSTEVPPVVPAAFQSSFTSDSKDSYMLFFRYHYSQFGDVIHIAQYNFEEVTFVPKSYKYDTSYFPFNEFLICDEALKFEYESKLVAPSGAEQFWFCYDAPHSWEPIYTSTMMATTETVGKELFLRVSDHHLPSISSLG